VVAWEERTGVRSFQRGFLERVPMEMTMRSMRGAPGEGGEGGVL